MALQTPKKLLQLKLLVHQNSGQVLYAEAGKDFVDFLFGLLGVPLGHAARLLTEDHMAGCLPTLCKSFHELEDGYFVHPADDRDAVFVPDASSPAFDILRSSSPSPPQTAKIYYRCSGADTSHYYFDNYNSCYGNYGHVTDVYGTPCPSCEKEMTTEMRFVPGRRDVKGKQVAAMEAAGGGYVKGVLTYMVMDNLAVMPMSTISAVTLLNRFHVTDLKSLSEWKVEVGKNEGSELLKASLRSKTVLTDVFVRKWKRGVSVE
ncbi:unnamed protein product [Musa acuminata var. zebrina]